MTKLARTAALLLLLALLCGLCAFLLRGYRDGGEMADWPRHDLGSITREQGRAFLAALPAGAPSCDRGPVRAVLLEDGKPLGESTAHDEIRRLGCGRFSFWHGTLYFSSSDGSDPQGNGRRYQVAWPSALASLEPVVRVGASGVLGLACALLLVVWFARGAASLRALLHRRRRLLAKLMLVPLSLLVTLLALEGWLRVRYPFADGTWPGRFDPAFGFSLAPNATVRQTNLTDYCVEQQTNSLGFLDREPVVRVAADTRRIVVLGDSFVEAVQVPVAAKFFVQLEHRLRARQTKAAVSAFGMSGCGTSNELAFYEHFASALEPDLVILLFVFNDFANNSPLLEAVRNGWHPEHLPRPFFGEHGGEIARLPVDAAWRDHLIPTSPAEAMAESWWSWSRLYRWTRASTDRIARKSEQQAYDAWSERLAWLRRRPEWDQAFAGWRWPDDDDFEVMTVALDPPPVFREAARLTEAALAALRDRVATGGGRLLVVGCHNLATVRSKHGRACLPRAWLDLVEPMCGRLGLPFLDLHGAFASRDVLGKVTFSRDDHWNTLGHESAAAAIDEYLQRHPELLAQ